MNAKQYPNNAAAPRPQVRRKAVVPAFHKQYYDAMSAMFARCAQQTVDKLDAAIDAGGGVAVANMESEFLSLGLDIIGEAVLEILLLAHRALPCQRALCRLLLRCKRASSRCCCA